MRDTFVTQYGFFFNSYFVVLQYYGLKLFHDMLQGVL